MKLPSRNFVPRPKRKTTVAFINEVLDSDEDMLRIVGRDYKHGAARAALVTLREIAKERGR